MLKIDNVSITLGKREILKNISLEIDTKTIVSISGKSGSGKTTLLGIISGLLKPNSGKVYFQGNDIFRWGDLRRSRFRNREMGFVFQFFNLFEDMTAYENILYPVSLNLFASKRVKHEINSLIDMLNIREIIKQYPSTLSGGEMQRVAIARAIINNPRFILADEPTGNVDDETSQDILDLYKRLKEERGITTIFATHEKKLVENSDVNLHLENGSLKELPVKKTKKKSKTGPKRKTKPSNS